MRWLRGPTWWGADQRRHWAGDAVAGAVVTVLVIPQSLAYAMLAGLPPTMGLYASVWPVLAYAFLGSSQVLAVGPVAVTRKACDKALMEKEKNFLLGIRTSAQWEEKDGFLILRGQMGEIKFQRAL